MTLAFIKTHTRTVLFTIFINDIADNINSLCSIFADDTNIFEITKNSITLQEDLAKLQEWSLGLHFNVNNLISVMFYILGIITPGTNAFKSREKKNQY